MRSLTVIAVALVLPILSGCAVSQQATVPVAAQDATLTLDQAVALLGPPAYQRPCPDGGRTLTWTSAHGEEMAAPRWPHGPYAVAAAPATVRTLAAQPAAFAAQATTLVIKFDAGGRMVWAREFLR